MMMWGDGSSLPHRLEMLRLRFKTDHQNPLRQLVELSVDIRTDCSPSNATRDQQHAILADLRIHPAEIEAEFGAFEVSFAEATLSVDFTGLKSVSTSKYGNELIPAIVTTQVSAETTQSDTNETETSGSLGIAVNLSPTVASGKASGSQERKRSASRTHASKLSTTVAARHHNVKAVGNDDWKIFPSPGASFLEGVYIDAKYICLADEIAGANRIGVDAKLLVQKRHVKVKVVHCDSWLITPTKTKMLNILIGKCVQRHSGGDNFDGPLILSRSRVHDEE